jgi:hypothetical protein
LLARRLGVDGVGQVWRNARAGYRTATVGSVARTAGVVSGAVRSLVLPVDSGRYLDDDRRWRPNRACARRT